MWINTTPEEEKMVTVTAPFDRRGHVAVIRLWRKGRTGEEKALGWPFQVDFIEL